MRSAPVENSESGQNPERYRHCMRGGLTMTKVGHWSNLRRLCESLRGASQETCLVAFHVSPGYGFGGCCLSAEKRPRHPDGDCRGRLLSIPAVTPLQQGFWGAGDCPLPLRMFAWVPGMSGPGIQAASWSVFFVLTGRYHPAGLKIESLGSLSLHNPTG